MGFCVFVASNCSFQNAQLHQSCTAKFTHWIYLEWLILTMLNEEKLTFTLDYRYGRFPRRFLIATILGIGAASLVLGRLPSSEIIILVLSAYALITLSLWALKKPLRNINPIIGSLVAWSLGALFLVVLHIVLIDDLSLHFSPPKLGLFSSSHIGHYGYEWVMALFVLPGTLVYEQLASVRRKLYHSEVQSAVSDLDFRIRPHFLFNSLNSVATLIHEDPNRAEEGLMDLADMFRTIMTDKRKLVPLADELDMVKKYAGLEMMRLGDRLHVEWGIEHGVDQNALIPILTLQPLIENAIYHGIETRVNGGTVLIKVRQNDEHVFVNIINPKPDSKRPVREGNHIAQQNVIDRFDYFYADEGAVNKVQTENYYTVIVKFPRTAPKRTE